VRTEPTALFLLAVPGRADTLVSAPAHTTLSAVRTQVSHAVPGQHFLVMDLAEGDWIVGDTNPRAPGERLLPRQERDFHQGTTARSSYTWCVTAPGQPTRIVAVRGPSVWEVRRSLNSRARFPDLPGAFALAPLGEGTWPVAAEGTVVFASGTSLDESGREYGPIPRLPGHDRVVRTAEKKTRDGSQTHSPQLHTPMPSPYSVVLCGSLGVQNLPQDAVTAVRTIITAEAEIRIGDAPRGGDTLFQRLLADADYRNVTVYHTGVAPRRNAGGWPCVAVPGGYTRRDEVMCTGVDYGLGVWDGSSKGTARNKSQLGGRMRLIHGR
jgi:hypothetical protein